MTPPKNGKAPSQGRIGCRIRVRPEHAEDAAQIFQANGFEPIYIENRDDGDVSFWFGKEPNDVLYRIGTCIPRGYLALQGIVVGDSFPFSHKPENRS